MLGSLSEADDAVQESWFRMSRSDTSGIEHLGGWLTTVVARVCLDMLRSRETRREESLDVHVTSSIVLPYNFPYQYMFILLCSQSTQIVTRYQSGFFVDW